MFEDIQTSKEIEDERLARKRTIVQTITIRHEGNLWFATSEDEPTIFVSAFSREAMNAALASALTKAV